MINMNEAVKEVLKEARGFVAQGWTQEASARNKDGYCTDAWGKEAVCWCAMGAIERATWPGDCAVEAAALTKLREKLEATTGIKDSLISFWNDEYARTQEEVLALFDRAIAEE